MDLSGANLKETNLGYSDLTGANLSNAQFDGTFYSGSNFTGATITDAEFNAILNPDGSYKQGTGAGVSANFTNANLSGSAIGGDLNFANFTNANLSGDTSFEGTSLKYANFTGANLTGALIADSDLTNAKFTGANVSAVSTWNNVTCPDGTNSDNDGDTCVNNLTAG